MSTLVRGLVAIALTTALSGCQTINDCCCCPTDHVGTAQDPDQGTEPVSGQQPLIISGEPDDPQIVGMITYGFGGGVLVDVNIQDDGMYNLTNLKAYAANYVNAGELPTSANPPAASTLVGESGVMPPYPQQRGWVKEGMDPEKRMWLWLDVKIDNDKRKYFRQTFAKGDPNRPLRVIVDRTAGTTLPWP